MKHTIRHGSVVIGYIHADLPMLGDEVIVETAFPESDPDDASQCSTFALGRARLLAIYEDHLQAPRPLPASPVVASDSDADSGIDSDDGIPF